MPIIRSGSQIVALALAGLVTGVVGLGIALQPANCGQVSDATNYPAQVVPWAAAALLLVTAGCSLFGEAAARARAAFGVLAILALVAACVFGMAGTLAGHPCFAY